MADKSIQTETPSGLAPNSKWHPGAGQLGPGGATEVHLVPLTGVQAPTSQPQPIRQENTVRQIRDSRALPAEKPANPSANAAPKVNNGEIPKGMVRLRGVYSKGRLVPVDDANQLAPVPLRIGIGSFPGLPTPVAVLLFFSIVGVIPLVIMAVRAQKKYDGCVPNEGDEIEVVGTRSKGGVLTAKWLRNITIGAEWAFSRKLEHLSTGEGITDKKRTGSIILTGKYRNGCLECITDGKSLPPIPVRFGGGFSLLRLVLLLIPLFGWIAFWNTSNRRKLERLSLLDGDEIEVMGRWKANSYVRAEKVLNITIGIDQRFGRGRSAVNPGKRLVISLQGVFRDAEYDESHNEHSTSRWVSGGRLERYTDVKRLTPVPLEFSGFGHNLSLKEGDEIEVRGRLEKEGTLKVNYVHNKTTDCKYTG